MQFNELELIEPLKKALENEGYKEPTPIQAQAIPHVLQGRDCLGIAQTGTGKTAAFALPILQSLANQSTIKRSLRPIQALVLAPTRELAIQIEESFRVYGKLLNLKSTVIYGGVGQKPQTTALALGIDILVATPGRLLDLIGQKHIKLNQVKHFVLDEADMMLDMGMIHDVRRIIDLLPHERQNLLFSATMPKEIANLSSSILRDPVKVSVTPAATTVDTITQSVYFVAKDNKVSLLIKLLKDMKMESVLIFSRTKHGADKIVKALNNADIKALAIHGNKSQNNRQMALNAFKTRQVKILVATDIAARGLDIDDLSHVLIYDQPEVPETYVHRIGRTGRAGLGGFAISFCDPEEYVYFKGVLKLIQKDIPVVTNHPFAIRIDENAIVKSAPKTNNRPKRNPSAHPWDRQAKAKKQRPSNFNTRKPKA